MYKEKIIVTVVPAHNEARHIAQVIETTPDFVDHVIVVDDCSQDGTSEAAKACGDSRLIILTTPSNQGVGGAVILGYRKSIELSGDIVVKMDGDSQMPPEYLAPLLDAIIDQDYDYAKGNRFLAGESLAGMPRHRLLGNVVLSFMTKLASGYWHLFDPQNGYTAIRHDVLSRLPLDRIRKNYQFENDMLIHLSILGVRAKDVPMPAVYGNEVSGMRLRRV